MEVRVVGHSKFAVDHGHKCEEVAVREHEVLMHASSYELLFKRTFTRDDRAQPWKRGIVKLGCANGVGAVRLLYRSAPVKGLDAGIAVVHDRTLNRLAALVEGAVGEGDRGDSSTGGLRVMATGESQISGRFLFYWDHPDDQARAAFKLGVVGVALGLLALPGTVDLLLSLSARVLGQEVGP